jgi:hypothetical protein
MTSRTVSGHHGVHGKKNVRMPRAEEVQRLFVQQPDAGEVLGCRVRRLVAASELKAVHLVEDLGEGDDVDQLPLLQLLKDAVQAPGENHESFLQGQPQQLGRQFLVGEPERVQVVPAREDQLDVVALGDRAQLDQAFEQIDATASHVLQFAGEMIVAREDGVELQFPAWPALGLNRTGSSMYCLP